MKNWRVYLPMLLMLLLCLSLAACGGDTSLQENPIDGQDGGLTEDTVNDFSAYEGIWTGDADNQYDYIEFDEEGNWQLYLTGDAVDEGYLLYEPEWETIHAYSSLDDSESRIALENGRLYIASFGYFNYGDGMKYYWYDDGDGGSGGSAHNRLTEDDEYNVPDWDDSVSGNGDVYYSWNSELCQRNVSEFQGVWYYDGDLSAETYIVIDVYGNWRYYQRAPGAEAAEMDCGILTYSADEVSTYYAESAMYDGLSSRVYEFDADMLVWGDEGVYYLMEQ